MIKMFIGSSSMGEDEAIERAYSYTIHKNCSENVDITWMRQSNNPDSYWSGFQTERWSTHLVVLGGLSLKHATLKGVLSILIVIC